MLQVFRMPNALPLPLHILTCVGSSLRQGADQNVSCRTTIYGCHSYRMLTLPNWVTAVCTVVHHGLF